MCFFWSLSLYGRHRKKTDKLQKTKSGLERKVQAPERLSQKLRIPKAKKAKRRQGSELSKKLRGVCCISGVGFFDQNYDNWRGSGSDIRLSYQMPQKILDKELWSTLRYLLDVAPLQTVDAGEAQMNGVVHFAWPVLI